LFYYIIYLYLYILIGGLQVSQLTDVNHLFIIRDENKDEIVTFAIFEDDSEEL
jgi:hypothetical protein